jgi:AAA15 family ATPase/GTPase
MKYSFFRFKNFKGIKNGKISLIDNPNGKVSTLVGLNESGKTTILEAINFFKYNPESLDALELDNYKINDMHSLIPIDKRDNFQGFVEITGGVAFDPDDKDAILQKFKEHDIKISKMNDWVAFTQKYYFEDSSHIPEKDEFRWEYSFHGRKGKERNSKPLKNEDALLVNDLIKKRMPSILYFPNFLFEFPEKIFLDPQIADPKHKYYQDIIQDILDSLGNETNLERHLIKRIQSEEDAEKRNLTSLIGKMEAQLTKVIFTSWNKILNKEIKNSEIKLFYGVSPTDGPYLEFNIKDEADTFRIVERSLGFRWFFVYILLTQFRSYRKSKKENILFLFDEPAFNLHPSAQSQLLESFENLPRVLYSTHSHYLINPKWLESTFVVKNEALDYNEEERFNPKKTDIKIFKYREFASKHPNQTHYFQPILDLLDFKPSNLDLIPNSVLCEGKNDYYTFNYVCKYILKRESCVHFIPCTSSNKMDSLISLYQGWGRDFLILLDSDKAGKGQKDRYLDEFGLYLKARIYDYESIDKNWKKYGSEKLFTEDDKNHLLRSIYPDANSFSKKLFNRAIQELYMTNKEINLSKETKENFERVLSFLESKF